MDIVKKLAVLACCCVLSGCITNNYIEYYVPPSIANSTNEVEQKKENDKEKRIFVYFIAPINNISVSTLIRKIDEYLAKNNVKNINIFINSGGGDTADGIAVYNYLKNLDVKVNTYNISSVKSAATYLYCAGDERYSINGSSFLFHNITSQLNIMDMDEVILRGKNMEIEKNVMIKIYKSCFSKNEKLINSIFEKGAIIKTPEDMRIGLTHKIIEKLPAPGKDDILL